MFTLEEINWYDNIFGSFTHFTVNTFHKQFISVYELTINDYQISRNTQALDYNQAPTPPHREEVTDCANSNNNKQKVLHYSESRDLCKKITKIVLNTDKLLCCLLCSTIFCCICYRYTGIHIFTG